MWQFLVDCLWAVFYVLWGEILFAGIPSFFWKGGIIELKCGKWNVIYGRKDERMRGMKKCVGWRISELGNEKGI